MIDSMSLRIFQSVRDLPNFFVITIRISQCAIIMHPDISNIEHLSLQLLSHASAHIGILSLVIDVEQFERVFLCVKQLPLLFFATTRSAGEVETFVVPSEGVKVSETRIRSG